MKFDQPSELGDATRLERVSQRCCNGERTNYSNAVKVGPKKRRLPLREQIQSNSSLL